MINQEEMQGMGLAVPVPQAFERAFRQVRVLPASPVMLGPMTATIREIRIGAQIVTPSQPATVGVGEYFDVNVDVGANNPGVGAFQQWAICTTMITTIGTLANYDVAVSQIAADIISVTMKLDSNGRPGPMPNSDITLRIKVFGYQGGNRTPPATNLW